MFEAIVVWSLPQMSLRAFRIMLLVLNKWGKATSKATTPSIISNNRHSSRSKWTRFDLRTVRQTCLLSHCPNPRSRNMWQELTCGNYLNSHDRSHQGEVQTSGGDVYMFVSNREGCVVLFFPFDRGYFCPTGFLLLGKVFNEATREAPRLGNTRGSVEGKPNLCLAQTLGYLT